MMTGAQLDAICLWADTNSGMRLSTSQAIRHAQRRYPGGVAAYLGVTAEELDIPGEAPFVWVYGEAL